MTEKKKGYLLLAIFVLMISIPFIYKIFSLGPKTPMNQKIEQIKQERKETENQDKTIEKFQKDMDRRFQDSGNTDLEQHND